MGYVDSYDLRILLIGLVRNNRGPAPDDILLGNYRYGREVDDDD
jgi:hypothetical protein